MTEINIKSLLRKNILELTPYASARSEFNGRATVFLDANENSLGSTAGGDYNRYPDPLQKELKADISRIKGVPAGQIFLGNGSDEAIDLLMRACCEPGKENILIFPPTYGMYSVTAQVNDVAVKKVLLTPDYQIDVAAALAAIDENTKLIFVCSPNNPTGNLLSQSAIEQLLEAFDGLVIVDEAYIDFAPEASWVSRLDEYPSLVILQTLSKAWGLASLRVGMAFGAPEVITTLNAIKPPYNIGQPSQELALEALAQEEKVAEWISELITERDALEESLRAFPFVKQVRPSDANFLLVEVDDATKAYEYLLSQGIVVRNRTKEPLCTNCIRITVGSPKENKQLIDILQNYTA